MTFIVATNNEHKLKEIKRVMERYPDIQVLSLKEAGVVSDAEETGTTFEENAYIKAEAVCKITGKPTIADDSGLMVDCLDGAPGVYSARYSGPGATDEKNNQKLLEALKGFDDAQKTCRFVSCVACVFPDGRRFVTRGTCEGHVGNKPKGTNGFGYDPLFYINENDTYASITGEQKDAISHRGKALALFAEKLKEYL